MAQASTPSCCRSEVSLTARPADQGRQQLGQTPGRGQIATDGFPLFTHERLDDLRGGGGWEAEFPRTCGCCVDSDFLRPTRLPYIQTGSPENG